MATDIRKDHERLKSNLRLLQKQFTGQKLREVLGVSKSSWANYMREPWRKLNYDDLRQLAKYCKVDFVALVDGELKIR